MLVKTPISALEYANDVIQAYTPAHSLTEVREAISRARNNLLFIAITASTAEGEYDSTLFAASNTPGGVLISHADDPELMFKLIEEDGVLMLEYEIEG